MCIRDRTKTVVKTGEPISARLADVLQRLEIYPMEVGLYLRAAYDGNIIYTSKDLKIDEATYFDQFVSADSNAHNLSNYSLDGYLIALKGTATTVPQSDEVERAKEEKQTEGEEEETSEAKDAESGMAGLGAVSYTHL